MELGFPFEESIRSLIPLVDEFVITVGQSRDETLARVQALAHEYPQKIRIIETRWNEKMEQKGFVYAQQKMIAQYSCTSDWVFYLEGDELIHEQDYATIRQALSLAHHHSSEPIEAIAFRYLHFYGSSQWLAVSPGWYRSECRIIRNTLRSFAPDGQYWLVMKDHKRGRYPRALLSSAQIYHYGHARSIQRLQEKMNQVSRFWSHQPPKMDYSQMDPQALARFQGSHPQLVHSWIQTECDPSFAPPASESHRPSRRDLRYRWMMRLERWLKTDLSRKNFKTVLRQSDAAPHQGLPKTGV